MSTIAEIEAAIARLPTPDVEALSAWLEAYCARQATEPSVETWLARARGAAQPGVTTDELMAVTRGDQ